MCEFSHGMLTYSSSIILSLCIYSKRYLDFYSVKVKQNMSENSYNSYNKTKYLDVTSKYPPRSATFFRGD